MALSSGLDINFEVVNNRKVYKCGMSINNNMETYKKVIASGLVLGALALSGCAYNGSSSLEKTIRGVPINVKLSHKSCSNIFGTDPNCIDLLNVVIKTKKGKYIACSTEQVVSRSDNLPEANILIETSIKEKKEIEIKMYYWKYRPNTCRMDSVSAYGNTIDTR